MRPFRFGVITSHAVDGRAWRERARRAEAFGYSTLFMPDHFQDQWAPIVGLTIAAEATERLNVGTLVFANDYRHPVVLAKEIATLDLASGGRVESAFADNANAAVSAAITTRQVSPTTRRALASIGSRKRSR